MPTEHSSNDPLHGMTLETILRKLVDAYGWEEMAKFVPIRCFMFDPSITSSLRFLRRTPWARTKVEELYLLHVGEEREHQQQREESPNSSE